MTVTAETDTIPRINLTDLFLTLRAFEDETDVALDDIRLRFCVNRKKKLCGDLHWSTAVANTTELQRLGLIEGTPFPKDRRSYEQVRTTKMRATTPGLNLLDTFRDDRGQAYDRLFQAMYTTHSYLRVFVGAIMRRELIAPVLTSLKEHVSDRYTSASILADDVVRRSLDFDSFLRSLEKRLKRPLTSHETADIQSGTLTLLDESGASAVSDDPTEFAKKLLLKLNDIVLPALLKREGLTFDYRTHRTIWSFGQAWKMWQAMSSHPDYDVRLVYPTATIRLDPKEEKVLNVSYDRGLGATGKHFLHRLNDAYLKLQRDGRGTYALAWELRSVFCYEYRCQESVFDRLMKKHYVGSDEFELQMDIQRQKTQCDRPLRVGNRNIGLIRVVKKGT